MSRALGERAGRGQRGVCALGGGKVRRGYAVCPQHTTAFFPFFFTLKEKRGPQPIFNFFLAPIPPLRSLPLPSHGRATNPAEKIACGCLPRGPQPASNPLLPWRRGGGGGGLWAAETYRLNLIGVIPAKESLHSCRAGAAAQLTPSARVVCFSAFFGVVFCPSRAPPPPPPSLPPPSLPPAAG